ncbi:MAG: antitoxin [Candidatus Lokiarchaeota archaeon]|nr:antitoxin [Candidatus Lokiarchaeota archaeon]
MPSKSISIKEEVYERLKKYKIKNESFSDTILRLLKANTEIINLAGSWKKIPDVDPVLKVIEETVKKIHEVEEKEIEII